MPAFIAETKFERLGVFKYSQEEGSRAAQMTDQIPMKTKNQRYRRAMALQQRIARELAEAQVGRELRLLVDQPLVGVAQSGAEVPIKSHFHSAMASGNCTGEELQEFVLAYGLCAGWPQMPC